MKTTLTQQLAAFEQGKFINSEGNESWCYNFYDWFCSDKALKAKSEKKWSRDSQGAIEGILLPYVK